MESTFIFPRGCLKPYLCLLFLIAASHVVTQSRGHSAHLLGERQEMQTDSKGEERSGNLGILPMCSASALATWELHREVSLGRLVSAPSRYPECSART